MKLLYLASVGGNHSQGYGPLRMAATKDLLSTNQNIIIRSSNSQLVQIGMKTTNIGIEDQNPPLIIWTWILLDYAINNEQQMQPIEKMKDKINFVGTHTKIRIEKKNKKRRRTDPAKLTYKVSLNNPRFF